MHARRRDDAVSEVIGFVLSFALSAIFLLVSLSVFTTARDNTDGVVAAVELKSIADRVAGKVVEASLVAQEYPNSTLVFYMDIPQTVNGHTYRVVAEPDEITVSTDDGLYSANATTFRLDALSDFAVGGTVYSFNGRLVVQYQLVTNPSTVKEIKIHEA